MGQLIPLGVYVPTAVQYLVRERLLPDDPSTASYDWLGYPKYSEELVWVKDCVVYSKNNHVLQVFRHGEAGEDVRFAFVTSFRREGTVAGRAIVILAGKKFHIHYLAGSSHVLSVPFEVDHVFPAAEGFLLQRRVTTDMLDTGTVPAAPPNSFQLPIPRMSPYKQSPLGPMRTAWNAMVLDSPESRRFSMGLNSGTRLPGSDGDDDDDLPHLFSLSDPLAGFCAVATATMAPLPRHLRTTDPDFLVEYDDLDASEKLIYISPCDEMAESSAETAAPLYIMVTRNDTLGQVTVWQGWYFKPKDLSPAVASHTKAKLARARRPSSLAPSVMTGSQTPLVRFDDLRRESFAAAVQPSKKPPRRSKKSQIEAPSKVEDEATMRSRLDPDFQPTQKSHKGTRKHGSLLGRAEGGNLEQPRTHLSQGGAYAGPNKRGSSMRLSQDRRSFGTSIYRKSRGSMAASTFSRSLGVGDDDSMDLEGDSWITDEADTELSRTGQLYAATSEYTSLDTAFLPTADGIRPEFIIRKVHVLPFRASSKNAYAATSDDFKVKTLLRPAFDLRVPPTLAIWVLDTRSKTCHQADFHVMQSKVLKEPDPQDSTAQAGAELHIPMYRGSSESVDVTDIAHLRGSDTVELVALANETLSFLPQSGEPLNIPVPGRFHVFDLADLRHSTSQLTREVGARRTLEVSQPLQGLAEGPSERQLCLTTADGLRLAAQVRLRPESKLIETLLSTAQAALTGRAHDSFMTIWCSSCSFLHEQYHPATDQVLLEYHTLLTALLSFAVGSLGRTTGRTPAKARPAHRRTSSMVSSSALRNRALVLNARSEAWDMLNSDMLFPTKSGLQRQQSTAHPHKHGNKLSSVSFVDVEASTRTLLHELRAQGHDWLLSQDGHDERIQHSIQLILAIQTFRAELLLTQASDSDNQKLSRLLAAYLAQMGHYLQLNNLDWAGEDRLNVEHGDLDWNFSTSSITDVSTISVPQEKALRQLTEATASPKSLEGTQGQATIRLGLSTAISGVVPGRTEPTGILESLQSRGLTQSVLESLPESSAISLREIISICQDKPPSTWPADLLRLVGREDASSGASTVRTQQKSLALPATDLQAMLSHAERLLSATRSHEADRHAIIVQIFPEDRRFVDASRLINPSLTQVAECPSRPEWSDIEHLDQQKRIMQHVMTRTVALPAGNAMIHFESQKPLISEKFQVPGFSMLCQMKPMDNTVSADRSNFTEDKFSWAFFHAGTSAGLHISRNATGIDTSWMVFNKPQELTNRHAGFLLALGLNGHLKTMAKWLAFKYLTPKHTMTSIGLLLGLSASHMGTMDSLITRMLSVHITRMLPAGAAELHVSPLTQTAGLLGIGLLYCNTQHRRMSEMMLSELEYREVEDSSSSHDTLRDESYRLAAGFALGLINLGKGNDLRGLHGMDLLERLLSIAVGPRPVELVHVVDKATAASIVAVALIYMKSNDSGVAQKIDVPDTLSQLEYTRPDALLLRALTKHLIMWDSVSDKPGWIKSQLPAYCPDLLSKSSVTSQLRSADIPTYNIIAGNAWALSLRFAGSGSVTARDEILAYLDVLCAVSQQEALYYDAQLTRTTVRRCIDILGLSAATVMGGTGDLVTFRYLRRLHGRTDEETTYGSHMAAHLAIGALFLGGGTYTFATSNLAVACLIMAFYPLFPSDVLDNAVHLQAFRHLWVLAAEARCVVVTDADSQRPVATQLKIRLRTGQKKIVSAPCLLPELNTVASVETVDPIYWHAKLDFENNAEHLKAFRLNQTLMVRKAPAAAASPLVFSQVLNSLNDAQNKPAWARMWAWLLKLPVFEEAGVKDLDLAISGSSRSLVHSDERTTVLDDRLSLWSDAQSWDAQRLSNIKALLAWAAKQRSVSDARMRWLGDNFIEKLERVMEQRMNSVYSS